MKVSMQRGKHSIQRQSQSTKKSVVPAVVTLVLFFALTACLYCIDPRPIAANSSMVGMGFVNEPFNQLTGVNWSAYAASQLGGYISIASMFVFFCVGVAQLAKTRSLKGVDMAIYLLAAAYVVMLVLYVGFDKLALNYRPVLVDGQLEPSYPSSHSFLAVGALGCAAVWARARLSRKVSAIITALCGILAAFVVVARLISGVHWLTDIVAGVLLGLTLVFAYAYAVDRLAPRK